MIYRFVYANICDIYVHKVGFERVGSFHLSKTLVINMSNMQQWTDRAGNLESKERRACTKPLQKTRKVKESSSQSHCDFLKLHN